MFITALDRQAAVALIGPRQVGKTTLALEIAKRRDALYLDLESSADRARLIDPNLILGQFEDQLVILDEIHRTPQLLARLTLPKPRPPPPLYSTCLIP